MKSQLKIILLSTVLFSVYHHGFAQWEGPGDTGPGDIYIEDSNVGIGTPSPRFSLDVRTNDTFEGNNFYVGNRRIYLAGITGTGAQMYGGLVLNNRNGIRGLDFVVGNNDFDSDPTPEKQIMSVMSSGNVGIGTNSPLAKLQIKQSNDNGFRLERDGHDLYELRLQGNTGLQILNKTDSRREMTFDGNGNIGIGTMDPHYKLEVERNHTANNNVEYLLGAFNHKENAGGVYMGYVGDGADAKEAVVRSGGNINLNLGTTTHRHALTISNATGALGIGTKEPAEPLHVQGTATVVANIGTPTEPHYKTGSHTLELQNNDAGDVILAFHRGGHSSAHIKHNSGELILSSSGTPSTKHLRIKSDGKVGIGTGTFDQKLTVGGSVNIGATGNAHVRVRHVNGKSASSTEYGNLYLNYSNNFPVFVGSSSEKADFYVYGKVGVGTNNPTETMEVNGVIRSKEILVESSPWPDYVFAPEYNLLTLEETAQFIEENQHLPGIPSAEEVASNGVALGNMNAKLLEKIEELTLHLIEQQKQLKEQKQLIDELLENNDHN